MDSENSPRKDCGDMNVLANGIMNGDGDGPPNCIKSQLADHNIPDGSEDKVTEENVERHVNHENGEVAPVSDPTAELVKVELTMPEPTMPEPTTTISKKTNPEIEKPQETEMVRSINGPATPIPEATSPVEMTHKVKWIRWSPDGAAGGSMIPVVTQNVNGPCPLLALVNLLFLRGQARLDPDVQNVSSELLLTILHDCIVKMTPQEMPAQRAADYQRNIEDALISLPKLLTGIDVNVRFTGVDQFEFTPDYLIFDLLNIRLLHGWLVEPEHGLEADAVGQHSYNQLIEFIIESKTAGDHDQLLAASLAENFLDSTATQLTYRGLCELNSTLTDGALCVFFRNNHFSTLLKHDNELFCLVTDQGFLNESRVMWESLNSVNGDSRFVDVEFRTVPPKPISVPVVEGAAPLPANASPQEQLDHDLMVALTLEEQEHAALEAEIPDMATGGASREESDRMLALKLQEEENKLAAQEQQRGGTPSGGASSSSPQQRHSPDSAAASVGRRSSGGKKDKCCII